MEEKNTKALISNSGKGLSGRDRPASRVIDRVSQDVMARAEAQGLSQARFRIGEYLLREPDYQQILLWSEAMDISPELVLQSLSKVSNQNSVFGGITFSVQSGVIVSLVWDFDDLPIVPNVWVEGLRIRDLCIAGRCSGSFVDVLSPCLDALEYFYCANISIRRLDLSQAPGLTKLY